MKKAIMRGVAPYVDWREPLNFTPVILNEIIIPH